MLSPFAMDKRSSCCACSLAFGVKKKKKSSFPLDFLIMWWYVIVILNCIFQVIKDVEHVFVGLFAICMSSLEKCLFKLFMYVLNWFFFNEEF